MAEVLTSAAVFSIVIAALMTGMVTMRRSYEAALHHSKSQLEQARIIDYISRDLRRAYSFTRATNPDGKKRINLKIPDYYQADGKTPRDPVRRSNGNFYGATPADVSFYQSGEKIVREINGQITPIATDVEDFNLDFPDTSKPTVCQINVTFLPKFRFASTQQNQAQLRAASTASATVLLRNKSK
jgi:Tfp pilus assembly protein PilW